MQQRKQYLTVLFLILPAFAIVFFIAIYPTVYSFVISLEDFSITDPAPANFIWAQNYVELFLNDDRMRNALFNTVSITAIAVTAELLLGLILAFAFNQNFPGNGIMRSAILMPMMTTSVCVGIIWRLIFNPNFGIANYFLSVVGLPPLLWLSDVKVALFAVSLADIWQWTPFMFLILFAGIRSLPVAPFEAAKIDGASNWQLLWRLYLPMLKRVVLIAVILRIIDVLKIFDIVYVMTKGGPAMSTDTVTMYIYRVSFDHFHTGYAAALSWVFLVIIMLASAVFLRYVRYAE